MLTLCLLNIFFSSSSSIIKRDCQVSWHGWGHFLISQSFVAEREFERSSGWPRDRDSLKFKGKKAPLWCLSKKETHIPANLKISHCQDILLYFKYPRCHKGRLPNFLLLGFLRTQNICSIFLPGIPLKIFFSNIVNNSEVYFQWLSFLCLSLIKSRSPITLD